jgi:hypothetical protein
MVAEVTRLSATSVDEGPPRLQQIKSIRLATKLSGVTNVAELSAACLTNRQLHKHVYTRYVARSRSGILLHGKLISKDESLSTGHWFRNFSEFDT